MTANHARKAAIRQRMAETGETYASAARAVAAQPNPGAVLTESKLPNGSSSGNLCMACGSTNRHPTVEHVIPQWARRAFDVQGWLTLSAREPGGEGIEQVARLQHLNVMLKDALCASCNNAWLGGIERRAAQILGPMAVSARATVLAADLQAMVALWAVKTGLLLELALRQMYPGQRAIGGYEATALELAWLRARNEPPPRSMVWLGSWDCRQEVPVRYEPSAAKLPTKDGIELAGHLTTFTLGFVAFQIFTVDFIAAEQHDAPVWNPRPPAHLRGALPRIWPPQLSVTEVSWPPPAFAHNDWRRMVTWDERLKPQMEADADSRGPR